VPHAPPTTIEHGTWLDREDLDALLGLSIPGLDEPEITRRAEHQASVTLTAQPARGDRRHRAHRAHLNRQR